MAYLARPSTERAIGAGRYGASPSRYVARPKYFGAGTVAGYTKLNAVALPNCIVRLYQRANGTLIASTISNGVGFFSFENLDSLGAAKFFAVAFHPTAGSFNALVYDLIWPEGREMQNIGDIMSLFGTQTISGGPVDFEPEGFSLFGMGDRGGVNADPEFPNVLSQMHFNGTNGSTTMTDAAGLAWVANGNAVISTAESLYNGSSLYLDGTTNTYVSTAASAFWDIINNDFTLEMSIKTTATNQYTCLVSHTSGIGAAGSWGLYVNGTASAGDLQAYFSDYSNFGPTVSTTGINVRDGNWHRICLERKGSTIRIYVDGTVYGTTTNFNSLITPNYTDIRIGYDIFSSARAYVGYVAEFRFTQNLARYNGAYTVASYPFFDTAVSANDPFWARTSSVLPCDGPSGLVSSVYDVTGRAWVINGTVENVKNAYDVGSHAYRLGDGYLTNTPGCLNGFNGDYTVDFWLKPTVRNTLYPVVILNYASYGAQSFGMTAGHASANINKYQVILGGSGFPNIQSSSNIVYGTWAHIALVRSGTTVTLYINGVSEGTATTSAILYGGGTTYLGYGPDTGDNSRFNGLIKNFRSTAGARWTAGFTPPASPTLH